jgi:hypothetical protein
MITCPPCAAEAMGGDEGQELAPEPEAKQAWRRIAVAPVSGSVLEGTKTENNSSARRR